MKRSMLMLSWAAVTLMTSGVWMGCGGSDQVASQSKSGAKATKAAETPKGPKGRTGPAKNRVVIIGFDGVDPDWVEQWKSELPNISKLVGGGPVPRLQDGRVAEHAAGPAD